MIARFNEQLSLGWNPFLEKISPLSSVRLSEAMDSFLTLMTFNQIIEMLPENFIRVHRTYVANMKHVLSAERSCLIMDDGTRLPVSDSRKSDLLQYVKTIPPYVY